MSDYSQTTLLPVAHGPGEGEHLWFFGALTTLKATSAETGGQAVVIEQLAPRGSGSPLHVHHNEDEWFYVLEGEITVRAGGQTVIAGPGSLVFGPRDVPHTFIVSSETARYLLVAQPAAFEDFVRALAEPAAALEIPPAPTAPPDMAPILAAASAAGIEILGPPGIPA